MKNEKFNSKAVALSGLLLAIVVILLYFESVLPVNKLSIYALSSFLVSIVIIELGAGMGWTFYITSVLLAALIVPDKVALVPYAVFFGVYGIFKYYIEKIRKLIPEIILKLIFFNGCLYLAILIAQQFITGLVKINFPWWVLILVMQVVMFVYDYVYTLFIQYYNQRFKRIVNRH